MPVRPWSPCEREAEGPRATLWSHWPGLGQKQGLPPYSGPTLGPSSQAGPVSLGSSCVAWVITLPTQNWGRAGQQCGVTQAEPSANSRPLICGKQTQTPAWDPAHSARTVQQGVASADGEVIV